MKQIALAVALGIVAVAAIFVYAQTRGADGAEGGGGRTVVGTTLDGAAFDLATARGKPVVVNFFASWCPPCNTEAPELAAFSAAHPEAVVVGVAVNDRREDTQAFVEKYGIAFPVVYDAEGKLGDEWGVSGIPTTFFLDAQGAVVDTVIGAASLERFEAGLEKAK